MVPKKSTGTWRPCGDYRRLNSITILDQYPVASLEDFAGKLNSKTIFSTIDLTRAYHQILVAKEDIPTTAVITLFGLYEFTRMTFGLCNAAQTFQRFMDMVLQGLEFCYCYIDDILVASSNANEHLQHLQQIFEGLSEYGLAINPTKFKFGLQKIQCLGYSISKLGTKPPSNKVEAISSMQKPKTIVELRRFLGVINFYPKFIKNAAQIQAPLHAYITNSKRNDKQAIIWTPEAEDAFELCKRSLTEALLTHPIENAPLALTTDGTDVAIGAVFEQYQGGQFQPLAFFSKKPNTVQRNYSAYDKELLAIYAAIRYFRHFLEGRRFVIKTDHKPLVYAFRQKPEKASPRQLRQLDFI